MDACGNPVGTNNRFHTLASSLLLGMQILPTRPLLFALVSLCVNTPAAVVKESNNTCKETKILQGIPDVTILMGKIFYYPVSACAFQGTRTEYKVTLASGADLPKWLEFNPNTNMLQGLPMPGESGEYLLHIAASGRTRAQKTSRAIIRFTVHVQESIPFPEEGETWNRMPNSSRISPDRCGKEAPVTSAEIVLYTAMEALQVQERLNIVHTMAEYLHLDSSFITLLQYKNLVHGGLQNQTILAKDTRRIKSTVNQYVGLSWPVKCGGFVVLHELIQVLRHNVESHHLSQLLGYEIVGWRILQRGGYEKKSPRRQRRQLMITPTPTLEPIRTTQRPTGGDAHSPVASDVLSSLLTRLVVSPVQSLASLHEESITIASYKMQNNIHLRSQENLATLEIDSSWDWMTNSPVSSIFGDSPDLSPSLIIKTPFPSTELEGLPTRASGMSLLLEQPAPHMPETNSYFLPGKSEISRFVLLQDITSNTAQFPRPVYTLTITTFYDWPYSPAKVMLSKTTLHVPLPEATSTSEVPNYSDREKSHFPEFEMLSTASLSPETLPSVFPNSSVRATTSSDFTFPMDYMFLPLPRSSSLSQELINIYEQLSRSFMTIPQPGRFPFTQGKSTVPSQIETETETLHPKLNVSPVSSVYFPNILRNTFPNEAETSYEPSLIILSRPDNAPVYTLPIDFPSFDISEPSRPTNILTSYDSSVLRTQIQSASALSSGTRDLHSDRGLGTRVILPSVTEFTLESNRTSKVICNAAEVPLVTLFNATSHLFSSIPEPVQTLLPSHQDTSTLLLPTYETLQSTETAWSHPPPSVSQELQNITTGQANTFPKVVRSIKLITATIGCLFFFPIPANTFYDEEDGNSTQLSLKIIPVDGSPLGSESWLQFNASQQTMHGYPLDTDFQYSPQKFILYATDSGGLTAWDSFTIELLRPTSIPCHLYTIRTKNSYYSFLRERKRISLFLEKLSLYLNSSTPKDLTVTTLKPGSTLISWYNSSLCTSANRSSSRCAKDEIQEALKKLRAPDGNVSPYFVQAMLPEYKIDVIVSVSYSEICFPTTKPFNGSFNSTVPMFQDGNDSRIRKTTPALPISLCVTAVLALIIVVCCSCKHHRKVLGSQFMTFQRNPPVSHADVEIDALKPRKAPVHECGGPPSPQLWIPPVASLSTQEQRSVRLSPIISSFQPPKYQIPLHYQDGMTSQDDQGNAHGFKITSFKSY